jgi:hypothetical protein
MHYFHREIFADDTRTNAEEVHVVVLDALVGGVCVVTEAGADTGKLVGGDDGADAAAADKDAALCFAALDGGADDEREIGVVDGVAVVGTDVGDFVAVGAEAPRDDILQAVSAVVSSDDNLHA